MFWRFPLSYELILKIILLVVLIVLILNIYILSLIFSSEGLNKKPVPKVINNVKLITILLLRFLSFFTTLGLAALICLFVV